MKKLFSAVVLMTIACVSAWSQDLITKRTGEDIKAKVTEVGQTEIKYKKYDNPDGPVYSIPVSEVLIIRYENGSNDIFNQAPSVSGNQYANNGAGQYYGNRGERDDNIRNLVPGMKYKEYKDFYKARDYESQPGDKYSPALGGVLSWLIPGLGQMVNGEVGRGFKYFGGAIACSVAMGVGSGLMAADMNTSGAIIMLAGSVAFLCVDIAAIVDGVKVAKIKNMYNQDMKKAASVNVNLSPYFATVTAGPGCQPVAGASLRVSF